MGGVYIMAVLFAFYRQDLRPVERLGLLGATASIMGVGIAAMKTPLNGRDMLFSELVWPTAALASLVKIGPSLDAWGANFVEDIGESDQARFDEAHEAGRSSVLDLVAAVRNEALRALALHAGLDDDLADLVRTRLTEVDERLEKLQCIES
jgi:hypothetical protein